MTRLTRTLAFAALAANVVGCAHDASQILTLRHASQSGRHEIPPQSKMRVKLNDGSEFKGLYLGRDQATIKLRKHYEWGFDGQRLQIPTQDVVEIRYRANRFRQGVSRGFRNGALVGMTVVGVATLAIFNNYPYGSGVSLEEFAAAVLVGAALGAPIGAPIGTVYGALRHFSHKPPIEVLIDADAWQIEGAAVE